MSGKKGMFQRYLNALWWFHLIGTFGVKDNPPKSNRRLHSLQPYLYVSITPFTISPYLVNRKFKCMYMSVYVKNKKKSGKKKIERSICLASQGESFKCKPFFLFKLVRREFFYNQSLYMLPPYQSSLHSKEREKRETNFSLLL